MSETTGIITGGPITGFTRGWAVLFMPSFPTRAHYSRPIFTLDGWTEYRARCGIIGETLEERRPPLAPGNFPLCKRCEASVLRVGT